MGTMTRHTRQAPRHKKKRPSTAPPNRTSIARVVRSLSEKKGHVTSISNQLMNTTPIITDLAAIPLGTDAVDRIGNVVLPTSLKFGWSAFNAEGSALMFRILIFQYFNTGTPVAAEVLDDTSSPHFAYSSYSQVAKQNFRVVYDAMYTSVENNDSEIIAKNNILIPASKLRKLRFDPAATTGTNKLWLYTQSIATGSGHGLNAYSLVRFTDM